MKKSLFLYLFILAALMNVFTYMYFSKRIVAEEKSYKNSNTKYKDSLALVSTQLADADYFSMEKNEKAQDYFDNEKLKKTIPYEKLIPYVTEKLMEYNDDPKGNIYTGQDKIGEQKFIINKAKVLNHRWIIADYNDGTYWGEVLLKYFINDDESVSFETIQSIFYQK